MKFKFGFATLERRYGGETADTATEEWVETDSATTASAKTMAGLLRAKADELDPPQKVMR